MRNPLSRRRAAPAEAEAPAEAAALIAAVRATIARARRNVADTDEKIARQRAPKESS